MASENYGIALGMIETRGLVPAIEAADAMTKAAEVRLVSREFVGGGYVTVLVRGETGAVNAAVRAGADACERVGDGLVAAHIIARPHREVEPVLAESGSYPDDIRLIIDIGTNGEIVLMTPEGVWATSCATGPCAAGSSPDRGRLRRSPREARALPPAPTG